MHTLHGLREIQLIVLWLIVMTIARESQPPSFKLSQPNLPTVASQLFLFSVEI